MKNGKQCGHKILSLLEKYPSFCCFLFFSFTVGFLFGLVFIYCESNREQKSVQIEQTTQYGNMKSAVALETTEMIDGKIWQIKSQ